MADYSKPKAATKPVATKSVSSMVAPGFYLVSFAKKDASVFGFGSQEVIVDIPKKPKTFLHLCYQEIGRTNPFDEFVIIAVSRLTTVNDLELKDD